MRKDLSSLFVLILGMAYSYAQDTRLLRQPSISDTHIAFVYGGDIWLAGLHEEGPAKRLSSTPAVESNPHLSPDGKWIAFSSNRSGNQAVYVLALEGGEAQRLTWHPSAASVRGWTPDGSRILYASSRASAPTGFQRLWTVDREGRPSRQLSAQWATSGSFSPDGKQIIIDRVSRWDTEWRAYRGGQNTPLVLLDLETHAETLLPNEATTDIQPVWLKDKIYFLSDRDWVTNIWSYTPGSRELRQVTEFKGSDIKYLAGKGELLTFERDGYLYTLEPEEGSWKKLNMEVRGDFPWAETRWEDVSKRIRSVSLSSTGKRAILESRGEIFTIPVEHGDARNISRHTGAADRSPIWSPQGDKLAWFSDRGGKAYVLLIAGQDGLSEAQQIPLGESKMGWEPAWSPDGKYIAFTDDDVRIRLVDLEAKSIRTIDTAGTNLERGRMGLRWSPDSKWLAYSRGGSNNFRQIVLWSLEANKAQSISNAFADSFSPAWDLSGRHLYFLASTNLALSSGWANTSAMVTQPEYGVYVVNLRKEDPSPFQPRSDEEGEKDPEDDADDDTDDDTDDDADDDADEKAQKKGAKKPGKKGDTKENQQGGADPKPVTIDFEGIERRTLSISMPLRNYQFIRNGPSGSFFVGESKANVSGLSLHKYSLKDRESKEFASGIHQVSVSADGKKILARIGTNWKVFETSKPKGNEGKSLKMNLQLKVDRAAEWKQIFEEAWRYERDYFYDPDMHGRDWDEVYERYAPLIPYVKHRSDLNYILDQMNGELSVGHSFVGGGDYPEVDQSKMGMLGADLVPENGAWRIARIFTSESWNPGLSSPLERPGLKVREGYYLLGINGHMLSADRSPYEFLDGTSGRQTVLHINKEPTLEGAWKEIVKPIRSEYALRQRAWVEDNRRLVDSLSNGRLAYVWVPNTGTPGLVSFDRYFFAQQDKEGAVIDERFNGGGLLDDYMVDLMTRSLRAALTNEVPGGKPMRLPAGILGPKVLLINELSGSGGDFFPWVFRQQNAGPLIGSTTWGGLVKSSVHYSLVDGGYLTAPDNAVFDPIRNKWVAENEGVCPDIAVRQDAKSLAAGKDPQLERAVEEALRLLDAGGKAEISPPPFSTPALPPEE